MMYLALVLAFSSFPAPHRPWSPDDEPAVLVEQVPAGAGGSYLALRVEGVGFTPWKAVAGPAGELYLAGTAQIREGGSARRGFGVLKLDADARPDAGFGRKLGEKRIGMSFVPVSDDLELGELVGAALQPATKPGREQLVLVANAERVETGDACMVLARIALRDGKPKKLGGELALPLSFGNDLEGRSLASDVFVDEHGITVVGDEDGNPSFLRLEPGKGAPDEGFGEAVEPSAKRTARSGRLVIPVGSFANAAYDFTTAVDAFTCQPSGDVFAVGHLLDRRREHQAFQTLLWVTAEGRPMPGFGMHEVDGGATTLFYELPESGAVPVELSMHSVVHLGTAGDEDATAFFAGLGAFRPPAGPPVCALNLWRLVATEAEFSERRTWTLESQIFPVDAHASAPAGLGLHPVALLEERDGQLLVVLGDEEGRVLASRHDVRDERYPDGVRALSPSYDGDVRDDLFQGIPPSPSAARVLALLQVVEGRQYLVVARVSDGEPTILRRFDTAAADPDPGW